MMQPDLELVQIGRGETFRAYEHGYPFSTVRWHFHPEYELHYVVSTRAVTSLATLSARLNLEILC